MGVGVLRSVGVVFEQGYECAHHCKDSAFKVKSLNVLVHPGCLERKTGLEPATPTLARSCSTN